LKGVRTTSDKANRIKPGLLLQAEVIQMCDANLQTANCRSRNEYVENAIRFYTGYLTAQNNTDFLCDQIAQVVSAIISNTENRIARMQFKEAVELAKITRMIAPLCELDDEQLRRLHILNELIERIEVCHTEGTGKNRVQRLSIHYSFVGTLDLPETDKTANQVVAETRQGVAVRYTVGMAV